MSDHLIKVGDLVRMSPAPADHLADWPEPEPVGIVIETKVNMWGEETVPSGAAVAWADEDDVSVVYEDELELINET